MMLVALVGLSVMMFVTLLDLSIVTFVADRVCHSII